MFKILNKKSFVSYPSRDKMVFPHNFNTQYMGGVHWMEIVESGQQFLNRGMFKILIDHVSLEPFHSVVYIVCTVYIISVLFITLKLLLNKMRPCSKGTQTITFSHAIYANRVELLPAGKCHVSNGSHISRRHSRC